MNTVSYPNQYRNYCTFEPSAVKKLIEKREKALPEIEKTLQEPQSQDDVVLSLYVLNLLLDEGVDKSAVTDIYPALSKYNDTKSPNIQTFLAGIYRKTKIPDGF